MVLPVVVLSNSKKLDSLACWVGNFSNNLMIIPGALEINNYNDDVYEAYIKLSN